MTRIQVSDETWTTYRAMLGPTPVSSALGKLVEREVASYRRRTALDRDGIREAVDDARTVADELATLIARVETGELPPNRARAPAPNDGGVVRSGQLF